MRLWSLHPQYLDAKGLVALWREALLAQAVLAGKTKGYKHHPQLDRFKASRHPRAAIATYLREVHAEALRRGYSFDSKKIGRGKIRTKALKVTRGQLEYEWRHLRKKLKVRDPMRHKESAGIAIPKPHPLFKTVTGSIADWEVT
ncbi:MAG TPA: pyrimidine dimer DNA glycosylase/endonuclease V [Gammaproteobacteria bacterium]|nr:pyrimidine dimer DNA glycosylase/endonuclease V [Gammaproteobacteria bacterium]